MSYLRSRDRLPSETKLTVSALGSEEGVAQSRFRAMAESRSSDRIAALRQQYEQQRATKRREEDLSEAKTRCIQLQQQLDLAHQHIEQLNRTLSRRGVTTDQVSTSALTMLASERDDLAEELHSVVAECEALRETCHIAEERSQQAQKRCMELEETVAAKIQEAETQARGPLQDRVDQLTQQLKQYQTILDEMTNQNEEMERQIKSLHGKARKATDKAAHAEADAHSLRRQIRELEASHAAVTQTQQQEAKSETVRLQQSIDQMRDMLDRYKRERDELQERDIQRQRETENQRRAMEQEYNAHRSQMAREVEALRVSLGQAEDNLRRRTAELEELRATTGNGEELRALRASSAQLEQDLRAAKVQCEDAVSARHAAVTEVNGLREQLAQSRQRAESVEAALADEQRRGESNLQKYLDLLKRYGELKDQCDAGARSDALERRLEAANEELGRLRTENADLQSQLADLPTASGQQELESALERLREAEEALRSLTAERDDLILERDAAMTEAAEALADATAKAASTAAGENAGAVATVEIERLRRERDAALDERDAALDAQAALLEECDKLEEENHQLQLEYARLKTQSAASGARPPLPEEDSERDELRARSEKEVASLRQQLVESEDARHRAEDNASDCERRLSDSMATIQRLREENADLRSTIASLKDDLARTRRERERISAQLRDATNTAREAAELVQTLMAERQAPTVSSPATIDDAMSTNAVELQFSPLPLNQFNKEDIANKQLGGLGVDLETESDLIPAEDMLAASLEYVQLPDDQ